MLCRLCCTSRAVRAVLCRVGCAVPAVKYQLCSASGAPLTRREAAAKAAEADYKEEILALIEQARAQLAGSDVAGLLKTLEDVHTAEYEAALEQLLAIVERDRAFHDDVARKTMVTVFDMMRDAPQAVSHWRRQLAAKLN